MYIYLLEMAMPDSYVKPEAENPPSEYSPFWSNRWSPKSHVDSHETYEIHLNPPLSHQRSHECPFNHH